MANLGTLVTNTIANVAPFQKGMRTMQTSSKGASKAMGALKTAAGALGITLGVGGLVSIVRKATAAFAEQELAETQLNAVLKSTGHAAGLTSSELTRMATSLASLSNFSDEVIIKSQSLLLTFTNISSKVFPEAQRTILDMATAMGTDLKGATIQLGKALNDPIKGVSALSEVGVSFTEQQRDQIKVLVATNDTLGAQKIILQELTKEFGGSAAAASQTYAGKLKGISDAFGTLSEKLGEAVVPQLILIIRFLNDAIDAAEKLGIFERGDKVHDEPQMKVKPLKEMTDKDVRQWENLVSIQESNLRQARGKLKEAEAMNWGFGHKGSEVFWQKVIDKEEKVLRRNEEKLAAIKAEVADPEHKGQLATIQSDRQAAADAQAAETKADLNAQIDAAREKMAQLENDLRAAKIEIGSYRFVRGPESTSESVRLQEAIDKLSDAVSEQKKALAALKES